MPEDRLRVIDAICNAFRLLAASRCTASSVPYHWWLNSRLKAAHFAPRAPYLQYSTALIALSNGFVAFPLDFHFQVKEITNLTFNRTCTNKLCLKIRVKYSVPYSSKAVV